MPGGAVPVAAAAGLRAAAPAQVSVFAVDPGTTESAYVLMHGSAIADFGKIANGDLLALLKRAQGRGYHFAVEMIASYGMAVGREVFETCVWIGRFIEAIGAGESCHRVYRRDVKQFLCGTSKAKDGNVRTAIIDRFGGKAAGVGTKRAPGPLYGISSDVWAALAVGITWMETRRPELVSPVGEDPS